VSSVISDHHSSPVLFGSRSQEEEARKREELERIMEENNRKIEEAQRKLVSTFPWGQSGHGRHANHLFHHYTPSSFAIFFVKFYKRSIQFQSFNFK
jgi:hypothetical protein